MTSEAARATSGLVSGGFPFPLAEPRPAPVMITAPCGCTSMVTDEDAPPIQVSWCVGHEHLVPGYQASTERTASE